MRKTSAEYTRTHRLKKKMLLAAETVKKLDEGTLPGEYKLPAQVLEQAALRVAYKMTHSPVPPSEGGTVILGACKLILDYVHKVRQEERLERLDAMKARHGSITAKADFGDDEEADDPPNDADDPSDDE